MTIPQKVRDLVYDRDDRCCLKCGVYAYAGSLHHRKNRSQGGLDVPSNLVVMCGSGTTGCHGWATERPTLARREGFVVPSWADPAGVPLLRYGRRILLGDDGGVAPYLPGDAA